MTIQEGLSGGTDSTYRRLLRFLFPGGSGGTADPTGMFSQLQHGGCCAIHGRGPYLTVSHAVTLNRARPHGYPARAGGLSTRRIALLPATTERRLCGSTVPAAEQGQAEQSLPKGIREPRYVSCPIGFVGHHDLRALSCKRKRAADSLNRFARELHPLKRVMSLPTPARFRPPGPPMFDSPTIASGSRDAHERP